MAGITDFKQKLIALYQSKSQSEQRLILLLGICFIVFILASTYSSVANNLADSKKKLSSQQELNVWAKQQIAIIKQSGQNPSSIGNTSSMTQVINSTARKNRITLARLQPQTADNVKVGLDDINFNQLMVWLTELKNKHGIHASNIDISKSDVAGVVRVRRLDLERN